MDFIRNNITIFNHLYSVVTGILSYLLLIKINKLPSEVAFIFAAFLPLAINHFKDKINVNDDSTELGKLNKKFLQLQSEYGNCKEKLKAKEALLIHVKTEITNHSTGQKKTSKEAQDLLSSMTRWFNTEVEFNNVSNESVDKLVDYKRKFDSFMSQTRL